MRASPSGFLGGVGAHQIPLWLHHEAAPRELGAGAGGGWLTDLQALGAGPTELAPWGLLSASAPSWALTHFKDFAATNVKAGGGHWVATRVEAFSPDDRHLIAIGTVPDPYREYWDCADVGPDGTIVMLRDGRFDVLWPDGDIETVVADEIRACTGGVLACVHRNVITLRRQDGSVTTPAQLPGAKWWVTAIGDWLLYQADGYEAAVCHPISDASLGYQMRGTYFALLEGVTLSDGRTALYWGAGAAVQGVDLRRAFVRLGEGMQPIVKPEAPPIPVPAQIRNGWFGMSDAAPLDCGNTTQGWYDDDPRPCVESAPWLDETKAKSAKCLGIIWSPIEAFSERDDAVRLALLAQKPILVYSDAHTYLDRVLHGLQTVRQMGADAFPFVQAYPVAGESTDESLARIRREIIQLIGRGEDRIAIWRYARYGAFPDATVDALLEKLTGLREDFQQIVYDVGFRKIHNLSPRLFDFYRRSLSAMVSGQPPPLYRPKPTPPIEPPIDPIPPTPEEPMPPTDPLKPGKTRDAYLDALAAAVAARTPMKAPDARQGILEAWDQLNTAKDWMSGNALVRGAFCRNGSNAVKIPQSALDLLSQDARAIDLEFLQR